MEIVVFHFDQIDITPLVALAVWLLVRRGRPPGQPSSDGGADTQVASTGKRPDVDPTSE